MVPRFASKAAWCAPFCNTVSDGHPDIGRTFMPAAPQGSDQEEKTTLHRVVKSVPTLVLLFVVHFVFCPYEDFHTYHSPSDGATRSA
jgi:hypothetical protein